jgi:hypothetical protein
MLGEWGGSPLSAQPSDKATTISLKSGWWYASDSNRKGPITTDELCRLLIGGTITPKSLIWKPGMEGWRQVRELQDLAPLLALLPPDLPSELDEEPREKAGGIALERRPGAQATSEPSDTDPRGSMPVPQARSGRMSLRERTAPRERQPSDTDPCGSMPVPQARSGRTSLRERTAPREREPSDTEATKTDPKIWLIPLGFAAGVAVLGLLSQGTRAFVIFLTQAIASQVDPIAVIGPILAAVLQRNYWIAMAIAFGWAVVMELLSSSLGQSLGHTYPFGHLLFQRAVGAMLFTSLLFGIKWLVRKQLAQSS